jgi:hypothetical protein
VPILVRRSEVNCNSQINEPPRLEVLNKRGFVNYLEVFEPYLPTDLFPVVKNLMFLALSSFYIFHRQHDFSVLDFLLTNATKRLDFELKWHVLLVVAQTSKL